MSFVTVPLLRGFGEVKTLFGLLGEGATICGGYARYAASPQLSPFQAGDVDVYCETEEVFHRLKRELRPHLEVKRETPIAVSYRPTNKGLLAYTPQVQLVKPVVRGKVIAVGSVADVLSNFDFTVARAAITSPETVLVDEDFTEDEAKLRLRLKNIHCPISSTLRCVKYSLKGYNLHPLDVLPLFRDWDTRDEAYRAELIKGLEEIAAFHADNSSVSDERLSAIYELMSID